jgi:cytochrome c-type biogenesis protein CcmI
MQNFWLFAAALVLLAAVFIIWPLWRERLRRAQVNEHTDEAFLLSNTRLIKQRILELEDEVSQGIITAKHKAQAIKELKLALAEEHRSDPVANSASQQSLAIVGMVLAVALAGGLYWHINGVDKLLHLQDTQARMDVLTQKIVMGEGGDITLQDVRDFSLAIRSRIDQQPQDPTGWMLLGRLYASMQMFDEAYQAYDKAIAINPADMNLREQYAQALMIPNQIEYLRKAREELTFILAQEPNNNNAALMLSLTASQLDDLDTAERYFAQIKDLLPADNPAIIQISSKIAELKARGDVKPTGFAININATDLINQRLASDNQLTPTTMFVFARDAAGSRPLPVAVKKLNLTSLPTVVNLTHTDAMVANWSLKDVSEVDIIVRLSYDDDVAAQPGEFTGSTTISVLNQTIQATTILIDEEVK